MSPRKLEVTIAGTKINTPIYDDEETTLEIVKRVNKVVADIEKKSPRINTQAFALEAALRFAIEVEREKADADRETRRLLKELKDLTQRLRALTDPPEITRLKPKG